MWCNFIAVSSFTLYGIPHGRYFGGPQCGPLFRQLVILSVYVFANVLGAPANVSVYWFLVFQSVGFCIPVHHRQFGYNLRMRFDSHRLRLWRPRQDAFLQALLSVLSPLRTFPSSSFSAFVNLWLLLTMVTHLVRINYTPLRFLLFCIYTILGAGDTSQSQFCWYAAVGALNAVTTFNLVDL